MREKKRNLIIGLPLCISLLIILVVFSFPMFNNKTGFQYTDNTFNSLAKGSTYFIADLKEKSKKFIGKKLNASIKMESPEEIKEASILYSKANTDVELKGSKLKISGDFGKVLTSVLSDADLMFNNKGNEVFQKYKYNEKEIMYYWWLSFKSIDKELKRKKDFEESNIINAVIKKAIEPSYNFYGIEVKKAIEHTGLLSVLLALYIIYTIWWGFGIYFLSSAAGFSMKKAKEKKEY